MRQRASTIEQRHHARIMAEGGCTVEDIAITLGISTWDVVAAAGDALSRHRAAAKEMARMLRALESA